MPVVVKAPDHQAVLFNKVPFCLINLATQFRRLIQMIVEGRLMYDQQIHPRGMRPLANIECCAERGCDPFDDRLRAADLECVHRFSPPRNTDILLNSLDYLPRRDPLERMSNAPGGP